FPVSCPFSPLSYGYHRHLHSFPTRRSSDLAGVDAEARSRIDVDAVVELGLADGEGLEDEREREHAQARDRPRDGRAPDAGLRGRSEEHTSELQSRENLVCRLLLEKKKQTLR